MNYSLAITIGNVFIHLRTYLTYGAIFLEIINNIKWRPGSSGGVYSLNLLVLSDRRTRGISAVV